MLGIGLCNHASPFGFLLQHLVKRREAFVARGRDLSFFHRLQNSASLLPCVGAFCISARPDIGQKLAEGSGQILLFKKVESLKVQHGKAGGVRKKSAVLLVRKREQLHGSGGIFSALDAVADLSRLQRQLGKELVEHGGFSHARSARKGGDPAVQTRLDVFLQTALDAVGFPSLAKDLKARLAVAICDTLRVFWIEIALGDHHDGLNSVELCNADQLVHRLEYGIGGRGGNRDEQEIEIGHGRTDQGAGAWKDLLDDDSRAVGRGNRLAVGEGKGAVIVQHTNAIAHQKTSLLPQGASAASKEDLAVKGCQRKPFPALHAHGEKTAFSRALKRSSTATERNPSFQTKISSLLPWPQFFCSRFT